MFKKTFLALSVAGALVATTATASEYEYEITPTIGGVMTEGNIGTEDHLSYGLRLGKNLHQSWFDQVELALDYAPGVDYENSDEDTNIFRGAINLIKDMPVYNSLSAYGLVGAGGEWVSNELGRSHDRIFVNYGAGLKYSFTDRFAAKLEARDAIKLNADSDDWAQHNLLYTLGLSYSFGNAASAAPAVAAAVAPAVQKTAVAGDDDGDGVMNNMDECPNTPANVAVDAKGCAVTISLHVNFDFGKSTVLPKYDSEIGKVADFMKKYPVYKVSLEGYTDSIGSAAKNMKLSDKRSAAVAKVLEAKGVDADRISTAGYGESNPVASNKTKEGRAENRRVEAVFSY